MLTPAQQALYRPLVSRAWNVHCLRADTDPDADGARETWYRRQLMDACGLYTTKQANQAADFDRLMGHFAAIAGDDYWIRRAAEGQERRLRFLINQELKRGQITEAYVMGITRNMGFLSACDVQTIAALENMPADHLWKLWNALRRHNKRHAATPVKHESPADVPF